MDPEPFRDGVRMVKANTAANLGFEDKLWAAADRVRLSEIELSLIAALT